jgi:hypothetical protein
MKKRAEQGNGNTIIVLGAGASIGSKRYPITNDWQEAMQRMPSSQHFFYDIFRFEYKDPDRERFINMLGLTYEGTHNLLVRSWGGEEHFTIKEWEKGMSRSLLKIR